jgi:hypothetical protein
MGHNRWGLEAENAFAMVPTRRVAFPGQWRLRLVGTGDQNRCARHVRVEGTAMGGQRYLEIPISGARGNVPRCHLHRDGAYAIRLAFEFGGLYCAWQKKRKRQEKYGRQLFDFAHFCASISAM